MMKKMMMMGSATSQRLIFLAAIVVLILVNLTSANSFNTTSIYTVLQRDYKFPVGILPEGVTGYYLNPSTGKFSAYFDEDCTYFFQGYFRMYFNSTVRGYIKDGRISKLEGVSLKWFFMSLDIVGVRRSEDVLIFSVGFAYSGFPIDNFEESPQCGCGFQCGAGPLKDAFNRPSSFSLPRN